jgi:hypothetical protein
VKIGQEQVEVVTILQHLDGFGPAAEPGYGKSQCAEAIRHKPLIEDVVINEQDMVPRHYRHSALHRDTGRPEGWMQ